MPLPSGGRIVATPTCHSGQESPHDFAREGMPFPAASAWWRRPRYHHGSPTSPSHLPRSHRTERLPRNEIRLIGSRECRVVPAEPGAHRFALEDLSPVTRSYQRKVVAPGFADSRCSPSDTRPQADRSTATNETLLFQSGERLPMVGGRPFIPTRAPHPGWKSLSEVTYDG